MPDLGSFLPPPPWEGPPLPRGREPEEYHLPLRFSISNLKWLHTLDWGQELIDELFGDYIVLELLDKRRKNLVIKVSDDVSNQGAIIEEGIPPPAPVEIVDFISQESSNYDSDEYAFLMDGIYNNLRDKGSAGLYLYDADEFGYVLVIARGMEGFVKDIRDTIFGEVFTSAGDEGLADIIRRLNI